MKLSKATPAQIDKLEQFLLLVDEYLKFGTYSPKGEDEPPQEPTPDEILDIFRGVWEGDWGYGAGDVWAKIMVGYRTLVENACDPDCSYLEWRPDIKAFLDSKEQKHGENNV